MTEEPKDAEADETVDETETDEAADVPETDETPRPTSRYAELADDPTVSQRLRAASATVRGFAAGQPRWRVITAPILVLALLAAAIFAVTRPDFPLGPDVEVDTADRLKRIEDLPTEEQRIVTGDTDDDPAELPAADVDPKWTYETGEDESGTLAEVADGGYLYEGDDGQIGFDAKGDKRWESDGVGSLGAGGEVLIGSSDIEGDDSWPGKDKVTVSDVATGKALWTDTGSSFSSAWGDQVYLSRCQGGQDGELGECVVTARDAHTGATRWSRSTYASTSVVEAAPDGSFVVFESHVTSGTDLRYTIVDSGSGAVLSGGFDREGWGGEGLRVVDGLVIVVGADDNPADDCRLPVRAVDVRSGAEVWDRKLGVDIEEGGDYCGGLEEQDGDHLMAYDKDRKPIAVDLRTGKTLWTAPDKSVPVTTNGEYALVEDKDGELDFYDVDADEKLWRLPEGIGAETAQYGRKYVHLAADSESGGEHCWLRVGLKTGDAEGYPGQCAGSGPGWIATVAESGGLRVYPAK